MRYVPEKLGVSIAKAKTHISPHFCEFAKRFIYKGEEISGFSVSALTESKKKYYLLFNLIEETAKRGFPFSMEISDVVAEFYGVVDNKPSRYRKSIRSNSQLFDEVSKFTRGQLSGVAMISGLFTKMRLPFAGEISETKCLQFL